MDALEAEAEDPEKLEENPEFYDQIQPGARRGDAQTNDHFLLIGIKAELFLPPGLFTGRDKAVIKKPSAY